MFSVSHEAPCREKQRVGHCTTPRLSFSLFDACFVESHACDNACFVPWKPPRNGIWCHILAFRAFRTTFADVAVVVYFRWCLHRKTCASDILRDKSSASRHCKPPHLVPYDILLFVNLWCPCYIRPARERGELFGLPPVMTFLFVSGQLSVVFCLVLPISSGASPVLVGGVICLVTFRSRTTP